MEKTPSSHGGQLRIYRISSRGQPTMGGPPAWGFGVGLTTPHRNYGVRYSVGREVMKGKLHTVQEQVNSRQLTTRSPGFGRQK
jgi:hypothetical protein